MALKQPKQVELKEGLYIVSFVGQADICKEIMVMKQSIQERLFKLQNKISMCVVLLNEGICKLSLLKLIIMIKYLS